MKRNKILWKNPLCSTIQPMGFTNFPSLEFGWSISGSNDPNKTSIININGEEEPKYFINIVPTKKPKIKWVTPFIENKKR